MEVGELVLQFNLDCWYKTNLFLEGFYIFRRLLLIYHTTLKAIRVASQLKYTKTEYLHFMVAAL